MEVLERFGAPYRQLAGLIDVNERLEMLAPASMLVCGQKVRQKPALLEDQLAELDEVALRIWLSSRTSVAF